MAETEKNTELNFDEFPAVSLDEWEAVIQEDLKGADYKEKLKWKSLEGIEVLPFYRREDLQTLKHSSEPIIEKAQWQVIQKIDELSVSKANEQALTALQNGATGLYFDLAANIIQSQTDLEYLLQNIHTEMISLHFSAKNSTVEIMYWLKDFLTQNDVEQPVVTFGPDPFAAALGTGRLITRKEIKHLISKDNSFLTLAVDASVVADAGASIIQQVAYALAAGNEYLNAQDNPNADFTELAGNIHFRFGTGSAFFPEIAKFRAFRLLWAQILNAYENNLAGQYQTFVHGRNLLWNKTASDAFNNMIRSTTEAMAAAIGGCDFITVERFDSNWRPPSPFASRIARNIQLILQHESYLHKVADAGAGSYYVEKLTDEIATKSWNLFQEIEKNGGLYESIKNGLIQNQIHEHVDRRIEAFKDGTETLVGINKYAPDEKSDKTASFKFDVADFPSAEFEQVEHLRPLLIEEAIK